MFLQLTEILGNILEIYGLDDISLIYIFIIFNKIIKEYKKARDKKGNGL